MGKISRKLKEIRAFGAEIARQTLESPIYATGISLYAAGVNVASIGNRKARLMARGHDHWYANLKSKIEPGARYIWVHAASLGEFEQGRPIMERIRTLRPDYKIILTFFSPSGYEIRKDYPGADIVCYLPYDTPRNARRFIELVNPCMAIFVKYEFWRNFLRQVDRHAIPLYLVSAVFRPDQAFFNKRTSWYKAWLRYFRHIFVQDDRSRRLLRDAGFNNVTVAGDTRFDRVLEICNAKKHIPELEKFRNSADFTLMAGSSWPQDENVYIPWVNDHPEVKVVVAPHEFDNERLNSLCSRFSRGAVLLSELKENPRLANEAQALIIDCFGLLSSAYAYADAAYVGGAFGAGLHNINEAAVYGIPVVFGPKHDKFVEASELISLGGAISIDSPREFARVADRLLFDTTERQRRGKWAGEYIREKAGATEKITSRIFSD